MNVLVRGSRNLPSAKWKCSCRIRPAGLRSWMVTSPRMRNGLVLDQKWPNCEEQGSLIFARTSFTYIIWICEWGEAILKREAMEPSDGLIFKAKASHQCPDCPGHLPQMTGLTPRFSKILPPHPPPPQLNPGPSFVLLSSLLLPSCRFFLIVFLNFSAILIFSLILQIVQI